MAKMIPPHWHDKTPSSEQRIFNMLQNDPATADWVVLHSLNLKQSGTQPYGEIDFVVLIPAVGVICLEVKGGRVACTSGTWTSTDSSGQTYTLKRSPFQQAQAGMHELRAALEVRLKRAPTFYQIPFGFVVVFTDVEAPPTDIATEPWEVIDCHSLNAGISGLLLMAAKQQRSRLHIRSSPPEPQPALLKHMRDSLRPDFERILSRGTLVGDSERKLLSLTEEQYEVLDLLGAIRGVYSRVRREPARLCLHLNLHADFRWQEIASYLYVSIGFSASGSPPRLPLLVRRRMSPAEDFTNASAIRSPLPLLRRNFSRLKRVPEILISSTTSTHFTDSLRLKSVPRNST